MKNFNRISMTLLKTLQIIFIILLVGALAFIIKWRIDHLYLNAKIKGKVKFTLVDELKKSTLEIENLLGKNDETYEIPVLDDSQVAKNTITLVIPEGCDSNGLGQILLKNNLIKDFSTYSILMEKMGTSSDISPGNYEIKGSMKVKEILAMICGKEIKTYEFSISSGANVDDVAKMLKDIGLINSIDAFKSECSSMGVQSFKSGDFSIEMPLKVKYIINEIKSDNL